MAPAPGFYQDQHEIPLDTTYTKFSVLHFSKKVTFQGIIWHIYGTKKSYTLNYFILTGLIQLFKYNPYPPIVYSLNIHLLNV